MQKTGRPNPSRPVLMMFLNQRYRKKAKKCAYHTDKMTCRQLFLKDQNRYKRSADNHRAVICGEEYLRWYLTRKLKIDKMHRKGADTAKKSGAVG